MALSWTIREGGPADRATLHDFHRALYQAHRDRVLRAAVEPLVAYRDFDTVLGEDVNALLQNKHAQVFMAEHAGEAVGYITGHIEDDPRRVLSRKGVVEDWYVLETARGQGIGRALMATLEAAFRQHGCQVVESSTWATDKVARRAHEALDFAEVQLLFRKPL